MKTARLVLAMLGVAGALTLPATAGNAAVTPGARVHPSDIGPCQGWLLDDSHIKELCSGTITYYRAWIKCTGSNSVFFSAYEQAGSGIAAFEHCATNRFETAGGYNVLGSPLLQQNV